MYLKRDKNGNKCLVLEAHDLPNGGARGFSIQTNGNLPKTHKMDKTSFDVGTAYGEARAWVQRFGTDVQRDKMGV